MNADTQELRTQLDQLQERLSARESTTHFAHAGVSTIAALLIGGAAGKLFYDSVRMPVLAWGATLLSLGLLIYAFRNYRAGRKVLTVELKGYETMLELRRQLRLDDPSALLPR